MHNPIAFVLLDRPVAIDMEALARALRERHSDLPVEVIEDSAGAGPNPHSPPLIRIGDQILAVLLVRAPIPKDQGLWSRASQTWPEAEAVAAQHLGHVIVSALGNGAGQTPVARVMTALIGALIATAPECCAVVWRSKVARPAKLWLEMSRQSFAPYPDYPFMLWLDLLPFQSDKMIGVVTMGLSAFAGREIEYETRTMGLVDVIDTVAGMAAYLVENGPVIKDGDTFGGDEQERFTIQFGNSPRFAGLPVFLCAAP